MTHDPLCPLAKRSDYCEHTTTGNIPWQCSRCFEFCRCHLIAEVRADERQRLSH